MKKYRINFTEIIYGVIGMLIVLYIAVLIAGQIALTDANKAIDRRSTLEANIYQIQLDNYYRKGDTK